MGVPFWGVCTNFFSIVFKNICGHVFKKNPSKQLSDVVVLGIFYGILLLGFK
jgi:hypothetical protein